MGRKISLRRASAWSPYQLLDSAFVVFALFLTCWLAWLLLREGFHVSLARLSYLVVFWVVLTYLALPRLHQILSLLYVPDYYIGRSRTADGILGDPVNLVFQGEEEDIHLAMQAAGWTMADDITLSSSFKIVVGALLRRSYPAAPVSPLYLFGHQQDFAYQQEVDGDPSRRHHVRFWRTPPGWVMPGGYHADWLAAATFDRAVGLSLFTLQVTHKIDADIDIERDHVVRTLHRACPVAEFDIIRDASTAYHSRNGGGDRIRTDGDMPVVDVNAMNAEGLVYFRNSALAREGALRSSRDAAKAAKRKRVRDHRVPPPAVLGASLLVGLQVLELLVAGYLLLGHRDLAAQLSFTVYDSRAAGVVFVVAGVVIAACLAGMLARLKWLRLVLLLVMSLTVMVRLIETVRVAEVVSTPLWITSATLAVLATMALTSPTAREWVRGRP